MISSKIKDLKIRDSLKKIEKIRNVKKFLFVSMVQKNSLYKDNDRASIIISFLKDNNKIENKSKTRITNRCVLNNRGRGVLRPYGISRTLMRELMQFGVLPGYSKAVW
jgi:ribosomal protein S14